MKMDVALEVKAEREMELEDYLKLGQMAKGARITSEGKSGPVNVSNVLGKGGSMQRKAKAMLLAALLICAGTQISHAQVSLLNTTQASQ